MKTYSSLNLRGVALCDSTIADLDTSILNYLRIDNSRVTYAAGSSFAQMHYLILSNLMYELDMAAIAKVPHVDIMYCSIRSIQMMENQSLRIFYCKQLHEIEPHINLRSLTIVGGEYLIFVDNRVHSAQQTHSAQSTLYRLTLAFAHPEHYTNTTVIESKYNNDDFPYITGKIVAQIVNIVHRKITSHVTIHAQHVSLWQCAVYGKISASISMFAVYVSWSSPDIIWASENKLFSCSMTHRTKRVGLVPPPRPCCINNVTTKCQCANRLTMPFADCVQMSIYKGTRPNMFKTTASGVSSVPTVTVEQPNGERMRFNIMPTPEDMVDDVRAVY